MGAYLLTAMLCEEDDISELRKTMEDLRIGEPKGYWHGSSEARRAELVASVAALPVTGFVVVHVEQDASDRGHRRKCMEFLAQRRCFCSSRSFLARSLIGWPIVAIWSSSS